MAYIRSYKNQDYLLPPRITDLFSKDHVCYLIEQLAESLDYSEFDKKYAGVGHPAYPPRINLKLLLMAYVDGIRSSRKIAKNAQENVVYIYLGEKVSPDFRTISDFRKDNKKLMKNVFREVNTFAIQHGLIDLSHLIPDSTTIKANANNNKILDKKTLEKLDKYIDKVIEEGIKIDEEEDKLYGDRGMHQLPKDLNDSEKRRPIIRKIVDEINKSMREDKKDNVRKIKTALHKVKQFMDDHKLKKYSFTDADARFMLNKEGRIGLNYNAQLVVEKNGLIISNDIVQDCDDRNQLLPSIASVEEDFEELPEGTRVLADGLYENGKTMQELDKRGFDLYIPGKNMATAEARKKKFAKANFFYDEGKDVYICPEEKELKNVGRYFNKKRKEYLTIYKASADNCFVCSYKDSCCKSKQRVIHATPYDKLFNRIKERLKTEEGKKVYSLRKQTVETSIGDIKHNKKFRDFLLRGIEKVKIEFDLVCTAHNLVMINNLIKKSLVVGY